MRYYTYEHRPGWGRDDHLADEVIARAARQLGIAGTGSYIAQHLGLASHPCPNGTAEVRVAAVRGAKARMRGALRRARREFRRNPDCAIVIVAGL